MDLLFLMDAADPRRYDADWTGADLVSEVVSPDDPPQKKVVIRTEYAQVGIPNHPG